MQCGQNAAVSMIEAMHFCNYQLILVTVLMLTLMATVILIRIETRMRQLY